MAALVRNSSTKSATGLFGCCLSFTLVSLSGTSVLLLELFCFTFKRFLDVRAIFNVGFGTLSYLA